MTTYCLIGSNGRIIEEIESNQSPAEMWYNYADGANIAGVLPKDKLPPDINPEVTGASPEPSGCEGYEEGLQMDRILSEGSQAFLDPIHSVSGGEDNEE
jgi:hypothetical protein